MKIESLMMTAGLMVALPAAMLAGSTTEVPMRVQAMDQLKALRAEALDAANHASELDSIARNDSIDWQVHATQLQDLRDDLNTMSRTVSRLEALRDAATPGERAEMDRAFPLLKEMAANTRSAIHFISENHGLMWIPEYQNYVHNLFSESDKLSSSLGQYVEFAKVRTKEQRLEKSLNTEAGE
ncbi:MAG: hypothetical protein M1436_02975 [Acidobacteria bacterium]|nr:hypothetical protein [Acidobacteriota bacterium]